jgi:hypothetical protein
MTLPTFITIIWSTEDVHEIRPDLTDQQAAEVLQLVERNHDAECGINWQAIEDFAEQLFPAPDELTSEE